eukprot:gene16886-biopygen13186
MGSPEKEWKTPVYAGHDSGDAHRHLQFDKGTSLSNLERACSIPVHAFPFSERTNEIPSGFWMLNLQSNSRALSVRLGGEFMRFDVLVGDVQLIQALCAVAIHCRVTFRTSTRTTRGCKISLAAAAGRWKRGRDCEWAGSPCDIDAVAEGESPATATQSQCRLEACRLQISASAQPIPLLQRGYAWGSEALKRFQRASEAYSNGRCQSQQQNHSNHFSQSNQESRVPPIPPGSYCVSQPQIQSGHPPGYISGRLEIPADRRKLNGEGHGLFTVVLGNYAVLGDEELREKYSSCPRKMAKTGRMELRYTEQWKELDGYHLYGSELHSGTCSYLRPSNVQPVRPVGPVGPVGLVGAVQPRALGALVRPVAPVQPVRPVQPAEALEALQLNWPVSAQFKTAIRSLWWLAGSKTRPQWRD